MKARDLCPTCGTALGPLHDKDTLRRCSSCARVNPRGFYYCGYCAAPMETTAHRAELAEVAAPPGGWPSLARELVEVRFFIDRGELEEAFERIAILRERYPGHPELAELQRGPGEGRPRPDTQVNRVVDSVLSSSSSLGDAMPRRAAPQWKAPSADAEVSEDGRTRAHEVVRPVKDGKHPVVRKRVARPGQEQRAGSFPSVSERRATSTDVGAPVPGPAKARPRAKTDRHAGVAPIPRPGETPAQRALASLSQPEAPEIRDESSASIEIEISSPLDLSPGMTVAVPTLQPPAPFHETGEGEDDEAQPKRARNGVRKRSLKARKRSGVQPPVPAAPEGPKEPEPEPRRRVRGYRFGSHVLGRLGGKDKG